MFIVAEQAPNSAFILQGQNNYLLNKWITLNLTFSFVSGIMKQKNLSSQIGLILSKKKYSARSSSSSSSSSSQFKWGRFFFPHHQIVPILGGF